MRRVWRTSFVTIALLASTTRALAGTDAGVPAQEVDFSDEEGLGGDEIQTRDPSPVAFDSIIPERFRVPETGAAEAEEPQPPPVARRRGGCAGCATGGAGEGPPAGLVLVLAALALLTARRRAAARRAPAPRR